MLVAPLSVSTPLRPIRKLGGTTPTFAARSSYQTQREREYLNATISRVSDLTPRGGVGFADTLENLRARDFKTYEAVITTLGSMPDNYTMKYSALDCCYSSLASSRCIGLKVDFDIVSADKTKHYNAVEEQYAKNGSRLNPKYIASNVIVANTVEYLKNRQKLSNQNITNLQTMQRYLARNCSTQNYVPVY